MKFIFSLMLFLLAFVAFPQEPIYNDADPPGVGIIIDVDDYSIISGVLSIESQWIDVHCMDAELSPSLLYETEGGASTSGQLIIDIPPLSFRIDALPNQNHLKAVRINWTTGASTYPQEGLFSKQVGKILFDAEISTKENTKGLG